MSFVTNLGSGEGAGAIRFARLGWEVDAVELSPVGAEKIEAFSRTAKAHVEIYNEDAFRFAGRGP